MNNRYDDNYGTRDEEYEPCSEYGQAVRYERKSARRERDEQARLDRAMLGW